MPLWAFDISPILEWAWAILQFTLDWVWIFCLLAFSLIMVKTVLELFRSIMDSYERRLKSGEVMGGVIKLK